MGSTSNLYNDPSTCTESSQAAIEQPLAPPERSTLEDSSKLGSMPYHCKRRPGGVDRPRLKVKQQNATDMAAGPEVWSKVMRHGVTRKVTP